MSVVEKVFVFVSKGCIISKLSKSVLDEIRVLRPDLELEVIDVESVSFPIPDFVVSTPTWVRDGKIVSVGNPDPKEFID